MFKRKVRKVYRLFYGHLLLVSVFWVTQRNTEETQSYTEKIYGARQFLSDAPLCFSGAPRGVCKYNY